MTSEQYQLLLQDLVRLSGLSDPSGLLEHGRVKIGDIDAVLEHEPNYDPDLLQVRMRLGTLPDNAEDLTRAILEANYISGYGGECVFSLYPASDDVVITMKVRLLEALTAQELWQGISDVARHGGQMWQGILAASHTPMNAGPSGLHGTPHLPV
ncbi:CesT family type III secretion system chaperone [Caenimonas koreensis]|uniref:Tir chaperone protein (CesT) family protein n=1 Tax=Caenimonas koreensis DSM 17982 TaxID=1121255 RepID=A0A844B8S7_9BURK|nr:CesT family type III secretion system chaperone [Caenimonas koreensis]MRD49552.1 hypothetical protein [Caenimonas koreensis DSM 17982]